MQIIKNSLLTLALAIALGGTANAQQGRGYHPTVPNRYYGQPTYQGNFAHYNNGNNGSYLGRTYQHNRSNFGTYNPYRGAYGGYGGYNSAVIFVPYPVTPLYYNPYLYNYGWPY